MRPSLVGLCLLATLLARPAVAEEAPDARELASLEAVHAACRAAEEEGRRVLLALTFAPSGYRLGAYDAQTHALQVDPRRHLSALEGRVALIPARVEPIVFPASVSLARDLRRAAERGARLRVGFFLGFDEPGRSPCLIRPAAGVTTVRADVAFAELLDAEGVVLARQDTERLRAWLDDAERDGVPGTGPRGLALPPSLSDGAAAPARWRTAVEAANRGGGLPGALAACHRDALATGASRSAQVVVRLSVDARSGAVLATEVELSSLGSQGGAACVARALRAHLRLEPAPQLGVPRVDLSVPVRLEAD